MKPWRTSWPTLNKPQDYDRLTDIVEQGYLDVANVIFGSDRKANWDLPRRFIWGLITAQWEAQLARSIRARRA